MTYQHHINHYRSLDNDSRYWMFSKVFLSLLLINTFTVAFYFYSVTLILVNVILGLVFLSITVTMIRKRLRMPFIEIAEGTVNYFDTENEEIVKVCVKDITHISTRLCELRIHTSEQVHLVNLKVIRNEQTRWEIKEKIRTLIAC
jgi:hypothetical protein